MLITRVATEPYYIHVYIDIRCICHNLTAKALPPCNLVKTLYSLEYGLPVHYLLLFPATFCMLNATMGIMHKKFVSVILHLVSAH